MTTASKARDRAGNSEAIEACNGVLFDRSPCFREMARGSLGPVVAGRAG